MESATAERMNGTVVKRSGARVFILEDTQSPDCPEKDLWFISARRFQDSADGWKVKPGDRVSFSSSGMAKRPNPVANDAYIVSEGAASPAAAVSAGGAAEPENEVAAPAEEAESFWRRCPICPGVVAQSLEEWEAHLAGEDHGEALRRRAKATAAPMGAPQASTGLVGAPASGSNGAPLTQSRFSFAQPKASEEAAPEQQQAVPPPSAEAVTSAPPSQTPAPAPEPEKKAPAASGDKPAGPQQIVLPRHSPDDPQKLTVSYKNGFLMEYQWPDVAIPTAVLRRATGPEIIRRQWLVQRLEVVMGEMDEQLPRSAFQNSAADWRESFLTRLEMHTGERWTWKKIDGELCLGEGKSSATFWRALRVGIQSSAHASHPNVLVVKPANSTQKMLFGTCHPSELPRSWEIPTHGKFIRLSFVRPELVYYHHHRLNGTVGVDDMMRELTITTEVDVPSLMPMWRLDWRTLMAMPEPIFPGAIHVVGSVQEAPRAIEKLKASAAPDGLIGLWGEWSGDTKGHEYNRLQVIQLATEKCSVVFKVGQWKQLPQVALELFTHEHFRTVALGGQEITKKLRKDFKVDVTNGIDVLDLPAAQRCQPRSLKGLVGVFLEWNVGMDQAGSPWDAPRLTPGQLTHAATRPWLVLVLYRRILRIKYNAREGVVEGTLTPKTGLM